MNSTNEMKKDKEIGCRHSFQLARIDTEQDNYGGSSTGFFYRKVGYAVCEKCGIVIKTDI